METEQQKEKHHISMHTVVKVQKKVAGFIYYFENSVSALFLFLMAAIPCAEFILRRFFLSGIPGATDYLRHLTLWVGFFGAILAVRDNKHLKIANLKEFLPDGAKKWGHFIILFTASAVCWALSGASVQLIVAEAPALPLFISKALPAFIINWLEPFGLLDAGSDVAIAGWLPIWIAEFIIPLGFAIMAVQFAVNSAKNWVRYLAFLNIPLLILAASIFPEAPSLIVILGIIFLVASAFLGLPIFALLGGSAILLFWGDGVTTSAIPAEMYRIVASPIFPTIPLFTLAGFILSESKTNERLVDVFRSMFGWIPGGTAVAITLLCAFFTTFTGASGITILALGGLLLPVLKKSGYNERFSVGLLTATGSLGLLFPPSLVVILYSVIAQVPIIDMFKAGLLPGMMMVLPICVMCIYQGAKMRDVTTNHTSFNVRNMMNAIWRAKWELCIPVVALVVIFGGFCTVVEASAITVIYTLFIEAVIYRDISIKQLFSLLVRCTVLVGGVLIVLGVAMGFTSYLVDAQVPAAAAEWAKANLSSPWIFLLMLNLGLIIVGCLMDIYSALIVVVPLILPIARAFNIDPVHLGIIFLANLQLGYLTPPVGMNLFLAAFRFDKPLLQVAKYAVPFLLVMLLIVILITYVPWLSIGFLQLLQ
jgi:tripartite ATP-independent transporter DctM subunit